MQIRMVQCMDAFIADLIDLGYVAQFNLYSASVSATAASSCAIVTHHKVKAVVFFVIDCFPFTEPASDLGILFIGYADSDGFRVCQHSRLSNIACKHVGTGTCTVTASAGRIRTFSLPLMLIITSAVIPASMCSALSNVTVAV